MDFFDGSNIDIEKEKRKNKMLIKIIIIALIIAPKSIITASFITVPASSTTGFLNTTCKLLPSPRGIILMSGWRIPLTSAFTIAVKALPIIIPTARSRTLPLLMNALNSFQSLNSGFFIFFIAFSPTLMPK